MSTSPVSRRRLLGVAGAGVLAGAAGAGGFAIADAQGGTQPAADHGDGYPFHGEHQAGIVTPAQDRLHFASFDVTTTSREELVSLLEAWTAAAAAMTAGRAVGSDVATGKITGEEEIWSHTDLFDFQANVDGAKQAFELLEPVLESRDEALEKQIDARFDALQEQLDKYRQGSGFVSYETVTAAQRKQLSDAVNALSEPLSKMTGVVAG